MSRPSIGGAPNPNADPNADPNAVPMADPNAVGPDGQPIPPDPNRPPLPPRPMGPPAMENMRRAMRTVFENYQPLSGPVAKPKARKRRKYSY